MTTEPTTTERVTMTTTHTPTLIQLSEVRPGDVLLVDRDHAPDPERNTVARIDGTVGRLAIIDFTNGQSTAPITHNPSVWVAR